MNVRKIELNTVEVGRVTCPVYDLLLELRGGIKCTV